MNLPRQSVRARYGQRQRRPDYPPRSGSVLREPQRKQAFVASPRWLNGVMCPRCEDGDPIFLQTRRSWKCRGRKKQLSVKVGTIFENSPIPLEKWLPALCSSSTARMASPPTKLPAPSASRKKPPGSWAIASDGRPPVPARGCRRDRQARHLQELIGFEEATS